MGVQDTISRSEVAAVFASDLPRLLLPPDIMRKYTAQCEGFLATMDPNSLARLRNELRRDVNAVIQNVLRGTFEPPLSAYLREIPQEVLCLYADRVLGLERVLRLGAQQQSEPITRPSSWNEYWLQLLLKH